MPTTLSFSPSLPTSSFASLRLSRIFFAQNSRSYRPLSLSPAAPVWPLPSHDRRGGKKGGRSQDFTISLREKDLGIPESLAFTGEEKSRQFFCFPFPPIASVRNIWSISSVIATYVQCVAHRLDTPSCNIQQRSITHMLRTYNKKKEERKGRKRKGELERTQLIEWDDAFPKKKTPRGFPSNYHLPALLLWCVSQKSAPIDETTFPSPYSTGSGYQQRRRRPLLLYPRHAIASVCSLSPFLPPPFLFLCSIIPPFMSGIADVAFLRT